MRGLCLLRYYCLLFFYGQGYLFLMNLHLNSYWLILTDVKLSYLTPLLLDLLRVVVEFYYFAARFGTCVGFNF